MSCNRQPPDTDVGAAPLLSAGGAIRRSYDTVAESYMREFSEELARKPFDRVLLDTFADLCPAPRRVLDVGCGPGHVARYLDSRGVSTAGVDLSDAMVTIARRLSPHLVFTWGDMRALEHPDDSLAGIVALYSIIHIPRNEVGAVLTEFRRVLVPEGRLLIAVHGGMGTYRRDEFLGLTVPFEATLFTLGEIASLVEGAGLWVDEAHQRMPYEFEHPTPRIYIAAHRTE